MKKTILFLLIVITLTACSKKDVDELDIPQEVRQWALSAKASSSYAGDYGEQRNDYSPFAATGAPDVFNCTDDQKAWVIEELDDGLHWLELSYSELVYPSSVRIRETLGAGAIVKIELKNNSEYYTAWEGSDNRRKKICPGFFEKSLIFEENNVTLEMLPFLTDTVKITLNTDIEDWNEIDAVELIGYEQKWHIYNKTLIVS